MRLSYAGNERTGSCLSVSWGKLTVREKGTARAILMGRRVEMANRFASLDDHAVLKLSVGRANRDGQKSLWSVVGRTMARLNAKRLANLVDGTESGRNARIDFFHESRTRNTHAIAHPLRAGLVQAFWLSDCVGWSDV